MYEDKEWEERIRCPRCEHVYTVIVEHRACDPFPIYAHLCVCGYMIIESEWDIVK